MSIGVGISVQQCDRMFTDVDNKVLPIRFLGLTINGRGPTEKTRLVGPVVPGVRRRRRSGFAFAARDIPDAPRRPNSFFVHVSLLARLLGEKKFIG